MWHETNIGELINLNFIDQIHIWKNSIKFMTVHKDEVLSSYSENFET